MTVLNLIEELQSLSAEALEGTVMAYDSGHKYPVIGVAVSYNKKGEVEVLLD